MICNHSDIRYHLYHLPLSLQCFCQIQAWVCIGSDRTHSCNTNISRHSQMIYRIVFLRNYRKYLRWCTFKKVTCLACTMNSSMKCEMFQISFLREHLEKISSTQSSHFQITEPLCSDKTPVQFIQKKFYLREILRILFPLRSRISGGPFLLLGPPSLLIFQLFFFLR